MSKRNPIRVGKLRSLYTGAAKSFLSVPSVSGGDPLFFHVLPSDGIVQPGSPARILVQPNLGVTGQSNSLPPETHRGTVTLQSPTAACATWESPSWSQLQFQEPRRPGIRSVTPMPVAPRRRCCWNIASLGGGFAVPAGWPLALQVEVRDNCGTWRSKPVQSLPNFPTAIRP